MTTDELAFNAIRISLPESPVFVFYLMFSSTLAQSYINNKYDSETYLIYFSTLYTKGTKQNLNK